MTELLTRLQELESIVENNDRSRILDLVDMLSSQPGRQLDRAICWALGHLSGPQEVPLLKSLLVKSEYAGRSYLAQALVSLGCDEDRQQLVALLLDQEFSINAGLGGSHLRFPELVPFVEPYCESSDWRIRNKARNFVDWQKRPAPASPATPQAPTDEMGQLAMTGEPTAIDLILESLDTLSNRHEAALALEILLERSANRLPTTALEKVTAHPSWILDCWRYEHEFGFVAGTTPVDMSHVKQLAAEELAQRREQA